MSPLQLSIDAWKTLHQTSSYIAQYAYTHDRLTPPLLQASRDLCKMITPNNFHI